MLRKEINQVRAAADDLRDRYRAEAAEAPIQPARNGSSTATSTQFDEAHTQIISNGARHRLA